MSLQTIDILKGYFHTGAKPTQQHFEDLIDTLSQSSGGAPIEKANPSEAQTGAIDDKYMTPQGVKQAILALTRLANIADLSAEVQAKITAAINDLKDGADPALDTLKKLGDALAEKPNVIIRPLSNFSAPPHGVGKIGDVVLFNPVTAYGLFPGILTKVFNGVPSHAYFNSDIWAGTLWLGSDIYTGYLKAGESALTQSSTWKKI